MRLQYWRDVLNGPDQDHANPLASALWAVLKRYQLPVAPLLALLDARVDDLYDSPPVDVTALELYCGETCSVLFRYAALILADGGETGPAALSGTAGVAYAMTGLLRASGWLAAEGRVVIDNADGALRPGASAVASIALPLEDTRRWLPREAVQPHEGVDVIFVPVGDGFEARPVRVGVERGGRVPVLSGLDGVERVVVRGAFALRGELERDELGEEE
jgi:hypothetical protein